MQWMRVSKPEGKSVFVLPLYRPAEPQNDAVMITNPRMISNSSVVIAHFATRRGGKEGRLLIGEPSLPKFS